MITMSYDLGVWYPHERLSDAAAGMLYVALCRGTVEDPPAHPAVDAFYHELTAKHPEIDTVPDEHADDFDYCPWSCALDRSPGHVIMTCVWSKAQYVDGLVRELARKHGLAVFDPQAGRITYPDSAAAGSSAGGRGKRPWWRFW